MRQFLLSNTADQDVLSLPYLNRLSERNLEFIKEFREEIDNNQTRLAAIIAGAICCALICIGLTYQRLTRARKSAVQIGEVIANYDRPRAALN